LVGGEIRIDAADVPELPDGVYYHFELIGATVYTENRRCLGIVDDILATGSADVYVVRDGAQEYLIPAAPDIVVGFDRESRELTIRPPAGLLEIND